MSLPNAGIPLMPEDHNPAWDSKPAPGSGVFVPPESTDQPEPTQERQERPREGRLARIIDTITYWWRW